MSIRDLNGKITLKMQLNGVYKMHTEAVEFLSHDHFQNVKFDILSVIDMKCFNHHISISKCIAYQVNVSIQCHIYPPIP